jgi:hypothetical protein
MADQKPTFDPNQPFSAGPESAKPAFDPNQPFQATEEQQTETPSGLTSFGRGLRQGATLGFDDELGGGAGAALEKLKGSDKDLVELYREKRDAIRRDNEEASKEHPYITGAGKILGSIPTFAAGGEIPAVAKLGLAGRGALEAGLMTAGDSNADLTKGEAGQFAGDVAKGAATGAVLNPAIHGVLSKIAPVAKGLVSKYLGPSKSDIDAYLANPEAINGARSRNEIHQDVLDLVNEKRDAVKAAQENLAKSQAAVDQLTYGKKADLRDEVSDQSNALGGLKNDASAASQAASLDHQQNLVAARDAARVAHEQALAEHQAHLSAIASAPHPSEMADDVLDSMQQVKQLAQEKSGDIATKLAGSSETVDPKILLTKLDDITKGLRSTEDVTDASGNVVPGAVIGSERKAAVHSLDGIKADFDKVAEQYPEGIPVDKARQMLQGINADYTELSKISSNSPAALAHNQFRAHLRNLVGPAGSEYDAAMKNDVEPLYKLLAQAHQHFGGASRDQIASKLGRLANPTAEQGRDVLSTLGAVTGRDFESPLQQHMLAQAALKDKAGLAGSLTSSQERAGLPQIQSEIDNLSAPGARQAVSDQAAAPIRNDIAEGQNELDYLRHPDVQASRLEDAVNSSPEMQNLQEAGGEFGAAEDAAEPFKGVNENTLQGKLASAQRGNSIANTGLVKDLSDASGHDFQKELNLLKTKEALQGGNTNGSRKVNLWSITGGALGATVGHPGPGAVIGAAVGAGADTTGSNTAKKVLDTYIGAGNMADAGIQRISNLLGTNPQAFKQFAAPLMNAAKRGPQAMAVANFVLAQQHPEYKQLIDSVMNQK